jgi:uncharacterized protein (TIGR03437 family)
MKCSGSLYSRSFTPSLILVLLVTVPLVGQSNNSAVTIAGALTTMPTPAVLVAPGQLITLEITGAHLRVPGSGVIASSVPLPTSLGGFGATLSQPRQSYTVAVSMLAVSQVNHCIDQTAESFECFTTQLTVQIPYDIGGTLTSSGVPIDVGPTQLTISEGGTSSEPFALSPVPDRVHLINGCDPGPTSSFAAGRCVHAITRVDGSLVSYPATVKAGDILVLYAIGLGLTLPQVKAGEPAPIPAPTVQNILLRYDFAPNARSFSIPTVTTDLQKPLFAGLVPGLAGLYQINFVVPSPPAGTPACDVQIRSNLTITTFGVAGASADSVGTCVDIQLQ